MTAAEAPSNWLLQNVALRLCPSAFSGIHKQTWASHGHLTDPEISARTAWVGDLAVHHADSEALGRLLGPDHQIEKISCGFRGALPSEGALP